MKKSLMALAVLHTFAAAAYAQTSVQIYGSFDGGIRYFDNVDAAGNSRLTMGSNGTYQSNRLGFRGVEDLGGGLNAHFTLETGFNTGTGALDAANTLFNRTASVGIGGAWGTIDFGRQYSVAFRTITYYEPFSWRYPSITLAAAATSGSRNNNDVQYIGRFGPLNVRAEYALGEVAGDHSASSVKAIGAVYQAGPVSAGGAYTDRRSAADLKTRNWTAGAAYKLGPARITVGYADQSAESAAGIDTDNKWGWVGVNYQLTPALEITPAWYHNRQEGGAAGVLDGKKNLYMLSFAYALSKRTNLYALLEHSRLDDALRIGTQDRQKGVAVGVNHLF